MPTPHRNEGEAWLGVGERENPRSFSKMAHKTPTIARAADGLGGTPWSGFSRRKCCRKVYTRCGRRHIQYRPTNPPGRRLLGAQERKNVGELGRRQYSNRYRF
jgi:hypothetical protein